MEEGEDLLLTPSCEVHEMHANAQGCPCSRWCLISPWALQVVVHSVT